MTKYEVEEKTVEYLKTVFDPEIPVNVWDLGMIYKIDVKECQSATPSEEALFDIDIDMTFTAPNCPAADFILEDIQQKLEGISAVKTVNVNVVFEPEWNKDMMSEEAKLDLGFM
jgi:metal-sulfur cluster biosynthetic enzyme